MHTNEKNAVLSIIESKNVKCGSNTSLINNIKRYIMTQFETSSFVTQKQTFRVQNLIHFITFGQLGAHASARSQTVRERLVRSPEAEPRLVIMHFVLIYASLTFREKTCITLTTFIKKCVRKFVPAPGTIY